VRTWFDQVALTEVSNEPSDVRIDRVSLHERKAPRQSVDDLTGGSSGLKEMPDGAGWFFQRVIPTRIQREQEHAIGTFAAQDIRAMSPHVTRIRAACLDGWFVIGEPDGVAHVRLGKPPSAPARTVQVRD